MKIVFFILALTLHAQAAEKCAQYFIAIADLKKLEVSTQNQKPFAKALVDEPSLEVLEKISKEFGVSIDEIKKDIKNASLPVSTLKEKSFGVYKKGEINLKSGELEDIDRLHPLPGNKIISFSGEGNSIPHIFEIDHENILAIPFVVSNNMHHSAYENPVTVSAGNYIAFQEHKPDSPTRVYQLFGNAYFYLNTHSTAKGYEEAQFKFSLDGSLMAYKKEGVLTIVPTDNSSKIVAQPFTSNKIIKDDVVDFWFAENGFHILVKSEMGIYSVINFNKGESVALATGAYTNKHNVQSLDTKTHFLYKTDKDRKSLGVLIEDSKKTRYVISKTITTPVRAFFNRYNELLVVDPTGRIEKFNSEGEYISGVESPRLSDAVANKEGDYILAKTSLVLAFHLVNTETGAHTDLGLAKNAYFSEDGQHVYLQKDNNVVEVWHINGPALLKGPKK